MNADLDHQPRTCNELIRSLQSGWTPKWVFFWGHTLAKDGSVTKSSFSQWWDAHPFKVDGVTYRTAEHWMMAEKARLFGDLATLEDILSASNPGLAKKLGRTVSDFDEATWIEARWEIVVRGNVAKFGQHPELERFLLGTGERVLVEASPRDRIWGIGMGASNPNAAKPDLWQGENLLGFALMEARWRLRNQNLDDDET